MIEGGEQSLGIISYRLPFAISMFGTLSKIEEGKIRFIKIKFSCHSN